MRRTPEQILTPGRAARDVLIDIVEEIAVLSELVKGKEDKKYSFAGTYASQVIDTMHRIRERYREIDKAKPR